MTELFTRNTVQVELQLQLIFHLDGQETASKTYVLSKLDNILYCPAKSEHPKEIFDGNFLFTSAAIRYSLFFQFQCISVPHSSFMWWSYQFSIRLSLTQFLQLVY